MSPKETISRDAGGMPRIVLECSQNQLKNILILQGLSIKTLFTRDARVSCVQHHRCHLVSLTRCRLFSSCRSWTLGRSQEDPRLSRLRQSAVERDQKQATSAWRNLGGTWEEARGSQKRLDAPQSGSIRIACDKAPAKSAGECRYVEVVVSLVTGAVDGRYGP